MNTSQDTKNGMTRREWIAAREMTVLQLREVQGLRFKEITRAMNLRGQDLARTIYARACRKREMGQGAEVRARERASCRQGWE
jgi:hypothetical protein